MNIPDGIKTEALRRIEPYDVEGFVLGAGDERSDIMIVGEAPGENEAVKGEPFIGRAGKELDKQLDILGLNRKDIYLTSVVRSRPYRWVENTNKPGYRKANRKPNKKEIIAHAKLLDYQIDQVKPSVIIALGSVAYQRLTGREDKMSSIIGSVMEVPLLKWSDEEGWITSEEEYKVVALYHPAAVFYNPKIRSEIEDSLKNVREYLQNEKAPEDSGA
ncbi:uracil-DNA glycosylase [Halobacillus litoralis]|uniref:uracil-DNA glycosylase n=1 Tax=Halobacillus litoralis TaxID=45668 RepID=UPI001CD7FBD0|nr:uracil-DNA glycosylase [Halobacillus litoralis]MCA0972565.1 uracil-DNA glycosylase [Halobacillus litoralis]